jgi:PAS domain S-box-containing protein
MSTIGEREWLKQVIDHLPQFVWTARPNGTPDYVDPRLLALLGVASAEGSGAAWASRVHPDDQTIAVQGWARAVAKQQPFEVEYRMRRDDGVFTWFATRAAPVRDERGELLRWVGTIADIDREVATREKLHDEQTRLSKIADAAPQMLYSYRLSPEGLATFPYVSPAFERKFGVSGAELVKDGISFFRLANPEDVPALMDAVVVSARDLSLWQQQWRVTAVDVGEIWVEAHSMPVPGPDGVTWHGTLSDVTERRRFEAEIRSLNQELEQRVAQRTSELATANRELEAFSYSVSHDLREPLRAVNGFCRALMEDHGALLPKEAQHFVTEIRAGALRMGRLIDDLLGFSRLGRQPLRRRPINVEHLVGECLQELNATIGKAQVEVKTLLPCEADEALLKQVFLNLLGNALKYSRLREEPRVQIESLRGEDGKVVYLVRDNGTGFDMKYAHKLFQVFQRLHRGAEFEGTGVGLAIVHRIVSRHGGRAWVEAAPDAGATFYFTLE